MSQPTQRWYSELNRYHWWVLIVSALGWLFDTMDQRLFILSGQPAIAGLMGRSAPADQVQWMGGIATAFFMFGWATGGLIFGVAGDKWGRARTMLLTILLYSGFTALSAFAVGVYDYIFYRFLTGL